MSNVGQVYVRVKQFDQLPNVIPEPKYTCNDMTAYEIQQGVSVDHMLPAKGVDFLNDPIDESAVMIPATRPVFLDNYVDGTTTTTRMLTPNVQWKVCCGKKDVAGPIIKDKITSSLEQKRPPNYVPDDVGAQWQTSYVGRVVPPTDITCTVATAVDNAASVTNTGNFSYPGDPVLASSRAMAEQRVTGTDTWWAVETDGANGTSGVGLNFEITLREQRASDQTSFVAIRINPVPAAGNAGQSSGGQTAGQTSAGQLQQDSKAFDLILYANKSPELIDWNVRQDEKSAQESGAAGAAGSTGATGTTQDTQPFTPAIRTLGNLGPISFGGTNTVEFLPFPAGAGKIRITINGQQYVYVRPNQQVSDQGSGTQASSGGGKSGGSTAQDNRFATEPFKFEVSRGIRVIGTTSQALIAMHPVAFTEGRCALPMPGAEKSGQNNEPLHASYAGDTMVDASGSAAPAAAGLRPISVPLMGGFHGAGVCDKDAEQQSNDPMLKEFSPFHGKVDLTLKKSSTDPNLSRYTVAMTADTAPFGSTENGGRGIIPGAGFLAPGFYRMRGVYEEEQQPPQTKGINISDDIISFQESFSCQDQAIIEHTMDLTIYNEGDRHSDLLERGKGIVVRARWSSSSTVNVFTGVSLGGSSSLVAGKETITVHCEDYMSILSNKIMINSPYYDGMDISHAVNDLCKRAGVKFIDDTLSNPITYYLPSGYSIQMPKMRFESTSNIKENMSKMCKLGERCVYFDEDGILHLDFLQGGKMYTAASRVHIADTYYSDPADGNDEHTIIDEKKRELRLQSTINHLIVRTVDRNISGAFGGWIQVHKKAPDKGNLIPYKKLAIIDQPILGCRAAAVNWLELVAERAFKPQKGISIKVLSNTIVRPLSFIKVDAETFRVSGVTRSYSAEENSLTTSIDGEWRGG